MSSLIRNSCWAVIALATATLSVSCIQTAPPAVQPPRYETLPAKENFPVFLQGTVLERMDHINAEPSQVSTYGLLVNLPGTGDGTAPTPVRSYIINEMVKRGFGTVKQPGLEGLKPEQVLDDSRKRTAIVRVDGFMPPGVRKGQSFDVVVTALPDSGVTSLAGGSLYRTELKPGGADPRNPGAYIDVQAVAEGPVFLNPAQTLNPKAAIEDKSLSRTSRRQGVILDGGISKVDKPLVLRLRAPQRSVIRQIEARINQHFQDPQIASAKDEAFLDLYVPMSFKGDWQRFIGVCMNLFLDSTPEILAVKAKTLADEAVKPDAPLSNISFAWEGMGSVALPAITPLMDPKYNDDVQFAAARAAAFIGDAGAHQALMRMASSESHRFQVDAVRTLGALRATPTVNSMLRRLTNAKSALVRVEAYRVLTSNGSKSVESYILPKAGVDERFVLDVMPGNQSPIVYATRSGIPRIAILGGGARIAMPITFAALDNRLTITSTDGDPAVTIVYRQEGATRIVKLRSRPDLAELIGWLGGAAREPDERIDLTYGEIVAVVGALAEKGNLISSANNGIAASFVLQEMPQVQNEIDDAPPIVPRTRDQSGRPSEIPAPRASGTTGKVSAVENK